MKESNHQNLPQIQQKSPSLNQNFRRISKKGIFPLCAQDTRPHKSVKSFHANN